MKRISVFWGIVLLCFVGAAFTKVCKKETLVIVKSTSQKFAGGARGSASGIIYIFYAKLNSDAKIQIDQIWVGGNFLERIAILPQNNESYKRGDTIQIQGRFIRPRKLEGLSEVENLQRDSLQKQNSLPIVKYTGEALIVATIKGKKKNIIINKIEALEPLNYQ